MKLTKSNIVFLSLIFLLGIFAFWDGLQINTLYNITDVNKWEVYNQYSGPAFLIAVISTFAILGLVVFFLTKDKGLGAGTFAAGVIMFMGGVEDFLFFLLGKQEMTQCMAWFDESGHIISKVSHILGQDCSSPLALIISALLSIFIAYKVFEYLRLKY